MDGEALVNRGSEECQTVDYPNSKFIFDFLSYCAMIYLQMLEHHIAHCQAMSTNQSATTVGMSRWWTSSSDTLIYPSIFAFPLFPLHCWSTTMYPCRCNHTWSHLHLHFTHTHFIGPASLIWWTHVLWFTCFISILSSPNMCPPVVQPIMNPRTTQSGTYYSFASHEPYAHFIVDHSYLTCLYLPFAQKKRERQRIA